eukprot:TRINITY_DN48474_c0_g1_i1.p1 TRINITY_DN48474_c0_g1~~TRINITY_DN48474_c0_g1_i1.p1  ORF type:complete len:260 (-),score=-0.24 TRINITY_DN48474_c0_g1_i1:274-1053(-)
MKLMIATNATGGHYRNLFDFIRQVRASKGLSEFWRGNMTNCLRFAPVQGAVLAVNELILASWNSKTDRQDFGSKLLAGGIAGTVVTFFHFPIDSARVKVAEDKSRSRWKETPKQFNGVLDCIRQTVNNNGLTALHRGAGVTLTGAFIHRGLQLGLFGQMMSMIPQESKKGVTGLFKTYLCATVANAVAAFASYPVDTIRRRLILESAHSSCQTARDTFAMILEREGARSFFRGASAVIFRSVGPIVLTLFERSRTTWFQ